MLPTHITWFPNMEPYPYDLCTFPSRANNATVRGWLTTLTWTLANILAILGFLSTSVNWPMDSTTATVDSIFAGCLYLGRFNGVIITWFNWISLSPPFYSPCLEAKESGIPWFLHDLSNSPEFSTLTAGKYERITRADLPHTLYNSKKDKLLTFSKALTREKPWNTGCEMPTMIRGSKQYPITPKHCEYVTYTTT